MKTFYTFLPSLSKIYCFVMLFFITLTSAQLEEYSWNTITTEGLPTGRHENAFIEFQGKFYLMGGRGINPVNVYDPATNQWMEKNKIPLEIHHFQAVTYKDAIYIIGGMTGRYPKEQPLKNIWKYYPNKDKWVKGSKIPKDRQRGGGGVVVYKNKFYMACGIKFGHSNGTTNYFDCFDPKTKTWESLTDAPHIRDHFSAIVVHNKLYCIGGRNTSVHNSDDFSAFFKETIPQVDYYNFESQEWFTMKNTLPIPTAAGSLIVIENNIVYFGGESNQKQAHNQTQCLNLESGTWKQLSPMIQGRHGTGAILNNNNVYICAGSGTRGGGKLSSMAVFSKK